MRSGGAAATAVSPPAGIVLLATRRGRVGAWVAAGALAAVLAIGSAGAVLRDRAPRQAMALWPANGFAAANAASRTLQAAGEGARLSAADAAAQRDLARATLRTEPLSPRALALLGLAAGRSGDAPRERALMRAATRLSRRDGIVNAWAVGDAGRRGDLAGAIDLMGRSILTDPVIAATYLPRLATALRDTSTVPVFVSLLRRRPAWEEGFWREAAVDAAALENAGEVRARLRRIRPEDRAINRALIQQLAGGSRYDAAARLYGAVADPARRDLSVVREPGFAAAPAYPPFDWEETTTGDRSGTVDPAGRRLVISGLPGPGGVVARQLLRLPAGRYRLSAERAATDSGDAATIALDVGCVSGGEMLAALTMTAVRASRAFSSDGQCGLVWLTIRVVPGESLDGYDLALRRVTITRLAGA